MVLSSWRTSSFITPCNFAIRHFEKFENQRNIGLKKLEIEPNSPGMVFLISKDALYNQLKVIEIFTLEFLFQKQLEILR